MKVLMVLMAGMAAIAFAAMNYQEQLIEYWKERNRPSYSTVEVASGDIIAVVNSTGTIEPVISVNVGAFVSGPVQELFADFNARVSEGDPLAKIDPRTFVAAVSRDKAILKTREAEVERARALLQKAVNQESRGESLRTQSSSFISQSEMDGYRFDRMAEEAAVKLAEAKVLEAKANLLTSEANLTYTIVRSPADGIIIERSVAPGQVVAAAFQTPKLFVVAPELDERVHVEALVDEADMGAVRVAEKQRSPVFFSVDAYPDDLFEGHIIEIRLNPVKTQRVVTYPVIIESKNPDMKLMPGMTANISFKVSEHTDVLQVPNAALRFFPPPQYVRMEDRHLIDRTTPMADSTDTVSPSAMERTAASQNRNRRHVWIQEGDLLRAVSVTTGLSDNQSTEVLEGDIEEGTKVVIGVEK